MDIDKIMQAVLMKHQALANQPSAFTVRKALENHVLWLSYQAGLTGLILVELENKRLSHQASTAFMSPREELDLLLAVDTSAIELTAVALRAAEWLNGMTSWKIPVSDILNRSMTGYQLTPHYADSSTPTRNDRMTYGMKDALFQVLSSINSIATDIAILSPTHRAERATSHTLKAIYWGLSCIYRVRLEVDRKGYHYD